MFTHLWALLPPPRTHSPPSENIKKETLLVKKHLPKFQKENIKTLLFIKTIHSQILNIISTERSLLSYLYPNLNYHTESKILTNNSFFTGSSMSQ